MLDFPLLLCHLTSNHPQHRLRLVSDSVCAGRAVFWEARLQQRQGAAEGGPLCLRDSTCVTLRGLSCPGAEIPT